MSSLYSSAVSIADSVRNVKADKYIFEFRPPENKGVFFMAKNLKSKYWRLELYPTKEQLEREGLAKDYDGSAGYGTLPDNWLEILEQTCLPIAISPLHDKDTKPDGSVKKPHYHIVINYPSSNTTLKAVKERIADELNAPAPFIADNPKGAYEYLWHKNSPEKFQYDEAGVIHLGGYRVPLTSDEVRLLKGELQDFIIENGIFEYNNFLDAVKSQFGAESDLYDCATVHYGMFNAYISSRRNELREALQNSRT